MTASKEKKLYVKKDWCKGCNICVAFCPMNTLELKDGKINIKDIESCTQCGRCELLCPDYAIYLGGTEDGKK
ncbi:4Fe-4S binding protein [Sporosalibacterium faouarense]|uniref:4Fe-4S binding protein n=1 Tax=Sporosalibacterium faouarense TaxID=516123 RepID=UPI00141CC7A0|nr:4Fe-4S dicluster domain-containing protein [Bacillota bacterium]